MTNSTQGRLTNKRAIVTGAGSGIGRASALLFAAEGARVLAADKNGAAVAETVAAIAYDTPLVGWRGRYANTLRLWSARAADPLHLDTFNRGDHVGALAGRARANAISQVLYPSDDSASGQELRLRQEYFFTAASLNSRASDMANLLDSMSNGVKTIEAADNGLSAITKAVESMQSTLRQARQDKSFKTESLAIDPAVMGDISFTGGAVGTTPVDITVALGAPDQMLGQKVVLALRGEREVQIALEEHLKRALPMFMQPREFRWFDALPVNPNGKTDRVALARLFTPERPE